MFIFVPICSYSEGRETESVGGLFKLADFRILLLLMICGGASEQAIAQWSSLFAETGLNVSKTVGDLLGPCLFGLMMALSRAFYGAVGAKLNLSRVMTICTAGLIGGYLVTTLSPLPVLNLIGCGIVGIFVGIMWPGTLSLATRALPQGGTSMFAVLALAARHRLCRRTGAHRLHLGQNRRRLRAEHRHTVGDNIPDIGVDIAYSHPPKNQPQKQNCRNYHYRPDLT